MLAPLAAGHVRGAESTLARSQPVEPAEAVGSFDVAPGFRLELVAAEPLVRDPISLEFDEHGAAYVLELPTYNQHAKPKSKLRGSVRRLEDVDGDGRFDRSTVFADDLNYPSGLFCYDGGLIVGDVPDLLWLRDSDGDGRADERDVLLTGFGGDKAGEGHLNSFRWGLDNRIHISGGIGGGDVRRPDESASAARAVGNRRVVLDPRTWQFEFASGGGQFGMSLDDWGRIYVCDNSRPALVLMYDDRYLARNPHMSAPPAEASIAAAGPANKLHRLSPLESWRVIRTKLRSEGEFAGPAEGGVPSGIFTAATGITVYRGDAWPLLHRGSVLVGEPANNLVHRMQVKRSGVSLAAERADARGEFLASRDNWFRPVQFAQGPDGAVHVIDMYRELIEGAMFLPPEVLAQMDPLAGCDRGRIFRIVPEGFVQPRAATPGHMTTEQLVAQLDHANGWRRDAAARLLYQRQDAAAVEPLRRLLANSPNALGRLHALYVLQGLGVLDEADVLRGMTDVHPGVREHAVKLAEPWAGSSTAVQEALAAKASDADAQVRYQTAFTAGELPPAMRDEALATILLRDGEDRWIRVAAQSSLGTGAAAAFERLADDDAFHRAVGGREFLTALARQIGQAGDAAELERLVRVVDGIAAGDDDAFAKAILVAAMDQGRGAAGARLVEASHGIVARVVDELLSGAGTTALDAEESVATRTAAIELLGCASFDATRITLDALLQPTQPAELQAAAVGVMERFDDAGVAELLLAKWATLTPQVRVAAAEALLSRPAWTARLLDAVQSRAVAAAELDPARVALLQSHPDEAIRRQAAAAFAEAGLSPRAEVVEAYQRALELAGDVERGRQAFRKACAACHQLEGEGTAVGADLHAIRDRGVAAVMLNILDPNREVPPQFLSYVATTIDGLTIAGMIAEETANDVTLRRADGSMVRVPRTDLESLESTGSSFMPEGLEQQLDVATMADLLAYLGAAE